MLGEFSRTPGSFPETGRDTQMSRSLLERRLQPGSLRFQADFVK